MAIITLVDHAPIFHPETNTPGEWLYQDKAFIAIDRVYIPLCERGKKKGRRGSSGDNGGFGCRDVRDTSFRSPYGE